MSLEGLLEVKLGGWLEREFKGVHSLQICCLRKTQTGVYLLQINKPGDKKKSRKQHRQCSEQQGDSENNEQPDQHGFQQATRRFGNLIWHTIRTC